MALIHSSTSILHFRYKSQQEVIAKIAKKKDFGWQHNLMSSSPIDLFIFSLLPQLIKKKKSTEDVKPKLINYYE